MKTVTIEQVAVFSDQRGWVFEPLTCRQLGGQQNAHLVITLPGKVRGNHFHRYATETVTVFGPARVCYRQQGLVETVDLAPNKALRFVFPPGTAHAVQNTGSQPQILVAFSDRPHDPRNPDTIEAVLIPSVAKN